MSSSISDQFQTKVESTEYRVGVVKRTAETDKLGQSIVKAISAEQCQQPGIVQIDLADGFFKLSDSEKTTKQAQLVAALVNIFLSKKEEGIKADCFSVRFNHLSTAPATFSTASALPRIANANDALFKIKSTAADIYGISLTYNSHQKRQSPAGMLEYLNKCLEGKIQLLEKLPKKDDEVAKELSLLKDLAKKIEGQDFFPSSQEKIASAIQAVQKKIGSLKPNESSLIPIFCAHTSIGQVMYLEITRLPEQCFSVRLFNCGEGIEFHEGFNIYRPDAQKNEQTYTVKKLPYLKLDKISEEYMTNLIFWQALFEMAGLLKEINLPSQSTPKAFYTLLLPLLEPASIGTPSRLPPESLVDLRAGTGRWINLEFFLLDTLPPKIAQSLIYTIRFSVLTDLYTHASDKLHEDEETRRLLSQSIMQFSGHAARQFASNYISLEELEQANTLSSKILTAVAKAEKPAQEMRKKKSSIASVIRTKITDSPLQKILQASPSLLEPAMGTKSLGAAKPILWDARWSANPSRLDADMKAFYEVCAKYAKEAPQTAFSQVLEFIVKLPVPIRRKNDDQFWPKLPQAQVESCMERMVAISMLLNSIAIHLTSNQMVELQFIYLKGLAIVHTLASRCENAPRKMIAAKWSIDPQNLYSHKLFNATLIQQQRDLLHYLQPDHPRNSDWLCNYFEKIRLPADVREDSSEEEQWIRGYLTDHPKEFETSSLNKILNEEAQKHSADITRQAQATCLMMDFGDETSCLPAAYVFLKKQALLLHAALKHLFLATPLLQMGFELNDSRKEFYFRINTKALPASQLVSDYDAGFGAFERLYQNNRSSIETFRQLVKETHLPHLSRQDSLDLQWLIHTPIATLGSHALELQVVKAIHYFSNHLHMLEDRNILCHFRHILFSDSFLEELLQHNAMLAEALISFMQNGYQYFERNNKGRGAMHMAYLTLMLLERLKPLAQQAPLVNAALQRLAKEGLSSSSSSQGAQDCLGNLLKSHKHLSSEIHSLQLYFYAQHIHELSEKDLLQTASLLTFIRANPAHAFFGHIHSAIQKLPMMLFEQLQTACKKSTFVTNLANAIAGMLGLDDSSESFDKESKSAKKTESIQWSNVLWDSKHFPFCTGSVDNRPRVQLNLLDFTIYVDGYANILLPSSIVNAPEFAKHFPNCLQQPAKVSINGIYEFKTNTHCLVRLINNAGQLTIQRQFQPNGNWYQVANSKVIDFLIHSKSLIEGHTHWRSCANQKNGDEIVFCKTGSAAITHRLIFNSNKSYFLTSEQSPGVQLLHYSAKPCPPLYGILQQFELPDYIHVWINKKNCELHSIEMPRLGLLFEGRPVNAAGELRVYCNSLPSYWLAEYQHTPALGAFSNYLVFQNSEGLLRVLIPNQPILTHEFGAHIALDLANPVNQPLPYFDYTVNSKGELEAIENAGSLFLAYILITQGRYKEAQHCLRTQLDHLKSYSKEELRLLDWIELLINVENKHPQFYAVYLTAAAIRLKNLSLHRKIDNAFWSFKKYADSYLQYLTSYPHVGQLVLNSDEELSILNYLAKFSDEFKFAETGTPGKIIVQSRLKLITEENALEKNNRPTIVVHNPLPINPQNIFSKFNSAMVESWFLNILQGEQQAASEALSASNFLKGVGSLPSIADLTKVRSEPIIYPANKTGSFARTAYDTAKNMKKESRLLHCFQLKAKKAFEPDLGYKDFYEFLVSVTQNPESFPSWTQLKESSLKDSEKIVLKKAISDASSIYDKRANIKLAPKSSISTLAPPVVLLNNETTQKDVKEAAQAILPSATVLLLPTASVAEHDHKGTAAVPREIEHKQAVNTSILSRSFAALPDLMPQQSIRSLLQLFFLIKKGNVSMQYIQASPNKNPTSLRDFLAVFGKRAKELSERYKELRIDLLKLANKQFAQPLTSEQRKTQAQYEAARLSDQTRPFDLETISLELGHIFLRNNLSELQRRNPCLTTVEIAQLCETLQVCLEHAVAAQILSQQVQALKEIDTYIIQQLSDEKSNKIAHQKLDKAIGLENLILRAEKALALSIAHNAKTHLPHQHLTFLLFEAAMGLTLYSHQVESLTHLATADFAVEHLIMGAGKSKVLLPILALLKADGTHLSVIITPAPLFHVAAGHVGKVMQCVFNRTLHALHIERNIELSTDSLVHIHHKLNNICKERESLIMTSKSLQCLLLKLTEWQLNFTQSPNDELRRKVQILQAILNLLKSKGRAIIDETHCILDPRIQVNFTIGKAKSMDPYRCELVGRIYEVLASNKDLVMLGGSMPLKEFTIEKEAYESLAKEFILEALLIQEPFASLLNIFNSRIPSAATSKEQGREQGRSIGSQEVELIKDYLMNAGTEETEQFVRNLPKHEALAKQSQSPELELRKERIHEDLALLKEQINVLLPMTLSRHHYVQYGPSQIQGTELGACKIVPYDGNNSPVETAQFLSPDALMNYTMQSYFKTGIPVSEIQRYVKELQSYAALEHKPIEQTSAYVEFRRLCGNSLQALDFFNCTAADCKRIADNLNKVCFQDIESLQPQERSRFFDYVAKNILTKISIQCTQLLSNGIDLVSMFNSVVGFTGTPVNYLTYAQPLQATTRIKQEIHDRTLKQIISQINKNKVRIIESQLQKTLIEDLVQPVDDALIDVGAILSGQKNEAVATHILELLEKRNSPKKGVVFFKNNQIVVLTRVSTGLQIQPFETSNLSPNQRFTYYDQPHALGADIPQHPFAQATVTVGKDSKLFEVIQGAYRMREIERSQRISLVMRENDARFFSPTNDSKELIEALKQNEKIGTASESLIAVRQKIYHVSKNVIRNHLSISNLSNPDALEKYCDLIRCADDILVSKQSTNAWESFGRQEKIRKKEHVIRDMMRTACQALAMMPASLSLFEKEKKAFLSGIEEQMEKELGRTAESLDKEILSRTSEDAIAEVETETLAQASTIKITALDFIPLSWCSDVFFVPTIFNPQTYLPNRQSKVQVHSVDSLFGQYEHLAQFKLLFADLLVTSNRDADSPEGLQKSMQSPTQYVLHIYNPATRSMQLLLLDTLSDFHFFWTALSKHRKGTTFIRQSLVTDNLQLYLSNCEGDIVQCDLSIDPKNSQDPFMQAFAAQGAALRLLAKVALGEAHFSFNQSEMLHFERLKKIHGEKLLNDYYTFTRSLDPIRQGHYQLWQQQQALKQRSS